jgi:hypothetical protein
MPDLFWPRKLSLGGGLHWVSGASPEGQRHLGGLIRLYRLATKFSLVTVRLQSRWKYGPRRHCMLTCTTSSGTPLWSGYE